MGVGFNLKADYDEDVLVYTKLDKTGRNLLMALIWGYSDYASYTAEETDYIYHIVRP